MIDKRETEELIERYCKGQLLADEIKIFEQWLESDPSLAEAVEQHQTILSVFNLSFKREVLRDKLNLIHDEMETEQFSFKAPLKKVAVEKSPSRIRQFYRQYRIVSIAAMVTIVAVSGTLITSALTGLFSNKQQGNYQALSREVERLKRSQRAIINGINESRETETDNVVSGFTGTGFALSKDGYVLTSYHVVKDAKSVFLSNEKFEQLEATKIAVDVTLDLALLKINDEQFKSFSDLPYGLKKSIADPGEKVFTLGYPREEMVYGEGTVSSHTGFEGDTSAYQVSIPVNPGNSGGPLFDNYGNLIGMISGRNAGAEGASFAIQSKQIGRYISNIPEQNISVTAGKNLKGIDRPAQVKKLKDFVFIVKVFN